MGTSDIIQEWFFLIPPLAYMYPLSQISLQAELLSLILLLFSAMPFITLVSILKYRAAHHRKGDIANTNNFSTFLKKVFLWEAKVAPTYSPILSGVWESLCGVVVWLLFPPQFALPYLYIAWFYLIPQMVTLRNHWSCFDGTDNFVFNRRRYRCIRGGPCYTRFEDGNQNHIYYLTADRHALIPPGDL
jgi:hypothetical protein